jgi:RNase P/RNase MRP subunit p30
VVADSFEQLSSSSFVPHLIVVRDFEKIKSFIKNKRYKSQIGLEVLLSDIRYLEGIRVGKWFRDVTDLYKFSKRFGYQFVISSGATYVWEMTSAQCIESIMRICDIPPQIYWEELEDWLKQQETPRLCYA